jgi:hypothetical protein
MRITIVLNDLVKFADQSRGLFVGKFKVQKKYDRYGMAIRESPRGGAAIRQAPRSQK